MVVEDKPHISGILNTSPKDSKNINYKIWALPSLERKMISGHVFITTEYTNGSNHSNLTILCIYKFNFHDC